MFRTTDMVLIAVMVAAAALTYKTKQGAEDQLSAVRTIERQIRFEQDSIDLLKADWSLLTQPARLQKLSEAYQADLELHPVDARQFARLAEVPMRNLDIKDIIGQAMGAVAAAGDATVEAEPKAGKDAKSKTLATGASSAKQKTLAANSPSKLAKRTGKAAPRTVEEPDETTTGAVDE